MTTAHVLVKNEENFIWYSIMSVINSIDKVMIWDTGSTDKTLEIISEIKGMYPDKIEYKEIGEIDKQEYPTIRQQMMNATKSDWVFILDGDEMWWRNSIEKVVDFIKQKGSSYESIVVPTINLVGDMFHFQEKNAGKYKFGKIRGHYNLRFVNKNIPGLHVSEDYGKEGFFDGENKPIQNREAEKIKFLDTPYLHATHLHRSPKDKNVMQRNKKMKYEIGIEFPKDFYYPESFFVDRPETVSNVWKNMDNSYKFRAFFETPLRKLKRRIL